MLKFYCKNWLKCYDWPVFTRLFLFLPKVGIVNFKVTRLSTYVQPDFFLFLFPLNADALTR